MSDKEVVKLSDFVTTDGVQDVYAAVIEKIGEDDSGNGIFENFLYSILDLSFARGIRTFPTVKDMRNSRAILPGSVIATRGYHKDGGIGKAVYDIYRLTDYRNLISNSDWLPDAEELTVDGVTRLAGGNHQLQNGLVAILRADILWAGQCGLEDPVEDEEDYKKRKVHHDYGLQKAVDFAKLCLSTNKSNTYYKNPEGQFIPQLGKNVRRNIILHVEQGRYVLTKTCWVPANVYLCGGDTWGIGKRCVDFIPLKPHLGGSINNYIRNYMFIFNGNRYHKPTPAVPMGATPLEQIYIAPYVGGMSGIVLSNYETDYGKKPDGSTDWYKPNYLKGIRGCMVFGGGLFEGTTGDRIWSMYHRPGVDWLDFYTDAWVIQDYKCNTPLENEEYQFDFNGSGDIIKVDGVQFPVNHPPEDKTQPFPNGEYPNGVVKGIKLHNWASWDIRPPGQGGSQEMIGYVGAGMEINRVINGEIFIAGYREVGINHCHMEFGRIRLHQGSATVKNTYFSKITGAAYNSIVCTKGQYGGIGGTLILENCEFHRGFDGAHLPVEDGYYDLVIDNNYTVTIKDCYQGWDTAGSNQEVAITVGIYEDYEETKIIPLPGWKRWAPYLSRDARIVRGKLIPQTRDVFWNGFEGVQNVACVPSRSPKSWDKPTGVKYYYYAQYIADVGDETSPPGFIPLGRNQRERNTFENGAETDTRYEAGVLVKRDEMIDDGKQDPYLTHYRPIIEFYAESDTLDQGYIRLYRGTNPYQYSEYVDLPMLSRAVVDDYGTTCFGRKWVANPVPFDTNVDLQARKRNLLPIHGNELSQYRLFMRAGFPLTDSIAVAKDFYGREIKKYYGTGYHKSSQGRVTIEAENKSIMVIEEGVLDNTTVFNRPFTKAAYANLPVTGTKNWDKSKTLTVENGTIARIVRTRDTIPAGQTKETLPLILQVEQPDGTAKEIYNIDGGEIVTAVYEEKEIESTVNGKKVYTLKGSWVIVNGAKAEDYVNPFYYIEPKAGEFVRLLPAKRSETLAIFDFVNSGEVLTAIPKDAAVGSRITIVRTEKQNGSLNILLKDAQDQNDGVIEITQTDATINLLRKVSGWVINQVITNVDGSAANINGKQYADLTPAKGIKRAFWYYDAPMAQVTDNVCILRLEHVKDGTKVPIGTTVRFARKSEATYNGDLTIIMRQTNQGATEKELCRFVGSNIFVDFVYDGTNWVMTGNNFPSSQRKRYVVLNQQNKFFPADEISNTVTYIQLTVALAEGNDSYITFDEACAVGTEVVLSCKTAGASVIIQTPSGPIVTIANTSFAHVIKMAPGEGPDKWMFLAK